MSSTDIVRDMRTLIQNRVLPSVPTKWRPQLAFGLEAFALRPFQSAGSNARSVVANANTAASKVHRLLGNAKLADRLGVVFDQLNLVCPGSYVNVDHSDFDGLTALGGSSSNQEWQSHSLYGRDDLRITSSRQRKPEGYQAARCTSSGYAVCPNESVFHRPYY